MFDDLVRDITPEAMDKSSMPFVHRIIGLACLGRAFGCLWGTIVVGGAPRHLALGFCRSASQLFLLSLKLPWIFELSTKRYSLLTVVTEVTYMFMVQIVVLLFTTHRNSSHSWLVSEAEARDLMVGAYITFTVLEAALVFALHRDPGRPVARQSGSMPRNSFDVASILPPGSRRRQRQRPAFQTSPPIIERHTGVWRDANDEPNKAMKHDKRLRL